MFAVQSLYLFLGMKSCDGHVVNICTDIFYLVGKNSIIVLKAFTLTMTQFCFRVSTTIYVEYLENLHTIISKCIVYLFLNLLEQKFNVIVIKTEIKVGKN